MPRSRIIYVISDFSSANVASRAESPSPRFQQQSNAASSQELPPYEERTKIVEDDPRSYTLEDKQEELHQRWSRVHYKTLGEGLMNEKTLEEGFTYEKAADPRR